MPRRCATPLEAALITTAPLRLRRPALDESLREAFNTCRPACRGASINCRGRLVPRCKRAMLHSVMVQLAAFVFYSRARHQPYYAGSEIPMIEAAAAVDVKSDAAHHFREHGYVVVEQLIPPPRSTASSMFTPVIFCVRSHVSIVRIPIAMSRTGCQSPASLSNRFSIFMRTGPIPRFKRLRSQSFFPSSCTKH